MSETKDEIAASRDALAADNERLRGELAAARAAAPGASTARVQLDRPAYLSEGERQALLVNGVTTDPFTGRTVLASDHDLEPTTEVGKANLARAKAQQAQQRQGIPGVTHVYPSVAPGVLAADAPVRGAQPAEAFEQAETPSTTEGE